MPSKSGRTKEQLLQELSTLKQRLAELEKSAASQALSPVTGTLLGTGEAVANFLSHTNS